MSEDASIKELLNWEDNNETDGLRTRRTRKNKEHQIADADEEEQHTDHGTKGHQATPHKLKLFWKLIKLTSLYKYRSNFLYAPKTKPIFRTFTAAQRPSEF